MYKDENNSSNASGPVGPRSNGISPLKIIFIILLCLIAMLAYKTYSKISGFLSFVSGEINAVSSTIQHSSFSTSGPVPLDDDNENGMIIEDNYSPNINDENDGEEAEKTQLPIYGEEINKSSSDNKDNQISYSEIINDERKLPPPFLRKLNPFELSLMRDSSSPMTAGTYSSVVLGNGYFKNFHKLTLENTLGTTVFIHNDADVYQFAFFPAAEKYANAGIESQRNGTANEIFKMLYEKVYGDGEYSRNKSTILESQIKFASACALYRGENWSYIFLGNYAFGCNKNGFTVLPKQASDKLGIVI